MVVSDLEAQTRLFSCFSNSKTCKNNIVWASIQPPIQKTLFSRFRYQLTPNYKTPMNNLQFNRGLKKIC